MPSIWYLKQGQRELGPLSVGQLCWLAQRGKLNSSDRIRGDGSDRWVRLPDIEELSKVCEAMREASDSSNPPRSKRSRWRDSDDDETASRSARLSRPTVPMNAPPRQQTGRDEAHRQQSSSQPKDDVYARHRLAKWRAKRSNSGTIWGLVCLILVGVLSAGVGSWMMSRVIRGIVADSPSTLPANEASDLRPSESNASKESGVSRIQPGLELRLSQIATWIHAGQGEWESPGRARLEVTGEWMESGRSANGQAYSKVLFEIRLANLDDRKTLLYDSWNLMNREPAILLSENDRSRPMVSLSEDPRVERKSRVKVSPGTSVTDVLVFRVPDDFRGKLRLVLPMAAAGEAGYVGFVIPREQLKNRPPMQIERRRPVTSPLLRPSRNPQR